MAQFIPNQPTVSQNAEGRLTPVQREQLLEETNIKRGVIQLVLTALLMVGIALCVLLPLVFPFLSGGERGSYSLATILYERLPALLEWQQFYLVAAAYGVIFVVVVAIPLFDLLRTTNIRRKVNRGRVAAADGEFFLAGSEYAAQAGSRRFEFIDWPASRLAPGKHRFYYLQGADWLLSAERVDGPLPPELTGAQQALAHHTEALAVAHPFTLRELAQNRWGQISRRQRRLLLRRRRSWLIVGALLMATGGLALIPDRSITQGFVLTLGGMTLIGVLAALVSALRGRVDSLTGPVKVELFAHGDTDTIHYYYLHLDRHKFEIDRKLYEALNDGRAYRVYYNPSTNLVLSLEAVDDNSQPA